MRVGTFARADGTRLVGAVGDSQARVLQAPTMLAWLAGEGREGTGETAPLAELRTLAPVPEPPSVRDFYAFEGHVAAGARVRGREIAPYWYEAPVFYFSNPAAILGPGEPLRRPEATTMLDFELELAAVIGATGGGELGIAGFTLMNDWSARDVQAGEVTVGLGPAKAKDFGTSLGPWLVTPDELPYEDGRLRVPARVLVNDREIASGHGGEKHFTWPDIVAHAARDTRLRPGDVLGSGTLTGGCLLELGPFEPEPGAEPRWIEPGDVVALEADGLGRLETPVV
ncbi:MAG TPA: fumarylacetoacetate hydrolase family protein [Solirubrobacterales bacterium]|nr:fumarylacetoacetate hydrolase family protein [Solirubrobacterales bacterium]